MWQRKTLSLALLWLILAVPLHTNGQADPRPKLSEYSSPYPRGIAAGSQATTALLSGTGFARGAVISVNGTPIPTEIRTCRTGAVGLIPSDFLKKPGHLSLAISNPGPGGGTSAPQTFSVFESTQRPRLEISAPKKKVRIKDVTDLSIS